MKEKQVRVERSFKFGESEYKASKMIEIPCNVGGRKIYIRTIIVSGEVPWLIGRETMEKMDMRILVKENRVELGKLEGIRVKTRRDRKGHMRMALINKVKKESVWVDLGRDHKEREKKVRKLHLQFGHPGWERLSKLIEESKGEENQGNGVEMEEIRNSVKKVTEQCEACIKFKKTPARPVVGMALAKKFNEVVALDLGEVEGRKFMVMIDLATKYCQACWMADKRPEEVVEKIMERWISVFGAPQCWLSDNGGEFLNEKFLIMSEKWNVNVKMTAAESPWSNGVCERWVGLLKDSVRKLTSEGEISLKISLGWAVVAKNSLYNNQGFSPNQLVFGANPIFPNLMSGVNPAMVEEGNELRIVRENLNAMNRARVIHIQQEAEEKIRRALRHQVREHKLMDVEKGQEVYYKREGEKEWRGPARVIGVDGKVVIVKQGGAIREIARVHITRVQEGKNKREEVEEDKQRREGETEEIMGAGELEIESEDEEEEVGSQAEILSEGSNENEEGDIEEEVIVEIPKVKKGERVRGKCKETGEEKEWKIVSLAGKRSSEKWRDSYNVKNLETGEREWVNLKDFNDVQVIPDGEEVLLGFESGEVLEAKMKELESWKENEVYREEKENGQKTISIRWIVTEKMKEGKRICKARLVARGFEEREGKTRNDAPTCSPEVLKLCLSVMISRGWECHSIDVKTAYLQGDLIKREVFIRPPVESGWTGIWRLRKTIYGLKDAARAWYEKVKSVLEELKGWRSTLEPVIFVWKDEEGEVRGILCSHVDDFCFGGDQYFHSNVMGKLAKMLKVGETEKETFKYIGVNIVQEGGKIWLDQDKYMGKIEVPDKIAGRERQMSAEELTKYRSSVGQINWVAQHTRPDLAFEVSDLSRAFQGGTIENMKRMRGVIKRMKENNFKVKLEKIEKGKEFWEVYADASFGNIECGKSQIGYIVSLGDDTGKRCPIQWKSQKAKRVAKSTIDAEALGLGEAAEAAIYLNKLWKEITGSEEIPVIIKTDSKTLERAIQSTSGVKSRRLRIDIAAIKEMIERGEIQQIEWVKTNEQMADCLTKRGVANFNIKRYMSGNEEERGRKECKIDNNGTGTTMEGSDKRKWQ